MPNWCYTTIIISHTDEEKLEKFAELLEEWTSKDYMDNGFGLTWLGNIVGNSGIGTVDTGLPSDYRCRGSITDWELMKNEIQIHTETAWSPMLKIWVDIVDTYLPDAKIIYYSIEEGNGILDTNDPEYSNKYQIDIWENIEKLDIEPLEDYSEKEVIKILQKLLNIKKKTIKALLKEFEESEYDDMMSIKKWDITPIENWK